MNEIAGVGNHLDFEYRGYDSRLGRFWASDPLHFSYPWNSDYAFAENDVIRCIDLEGLEKFYTIDGVFIGAGDPADRRKMMVLTPATEKAVREMTAEDRAALMKNLPWDIVTFPPPKRVDMFDETIEYSHRKEHGFLMATDGELNPTQSDIVPGTAGEVKLGDEALKMKDNGQVVTSDFHAHTFDFTWEDGVLTPSSNYGPSHAGNTPDKLPGDVEKQARLRADGTFSESSAVGYKKHEVVPPQKVPGRTTRGEEGSIASPNNVTYYGGEKNQSRTLHEDYEIDRTHLRMLFSRRRW